MSLTTKNLLTAAATVVFALAATATTVGTAYAQSASTTNPTTTPATAPTASQASAGLTREQVQAEYFATRKNGTLIENETDMDVAQTKKHFAK